MFTDCRVIVVFAMLVIIIIVLIWTISSAINKIKECSEFPESQYTEIESRKLNILAAVAVAVDKANADGKKIAITEPIELPGFADFRNDIVQRLRDNGCTLYSVTMSEPVVVYSKDGSRNYRNYIISLYINPPYIDYDQAHFLEMVH